MSKFMIPAMSVAPIFIRAVNRIAKAIFGERRNQGEIILEVRLDRVKAVAA